MGPEAGTHALRVGILCTGTTFQRWQAEAIRHVMAVPGVEIVVLIVDERATSDTKARQPIGQLLYRKYRQHFFKPAAMQSVDLSAELGDVPRVMCMPRMERRREHFDRKYLDAIKGHQPDVLLRFGFNILSGAILEAAPHGIWSFHHGDGTKFRGGPPGLWEIMKGSKITGAILQRLTEDLDGGFILRKGAFATIDHSLEETVDTVLTHTAIWPAQVMREILNGNPQASNGEPCGQLGPIYRYPGNFTFVRFLWKLFRNKMRFHRREMNEHDEWNIGVLYQPISVFLDDEASLNVRWLPPPSANNFRADPFGYIAADGALNVLYEKFDHTTGKGEISRVRPRKDSVLKRSRIMLSTEGHLSYPYVVQRDGAVYVIPESADQGRVDLFRLNDENDGLQFLKTLLNEPLFDPTVFEYEGRWWMFGTKAPLTNVSLHAYYSDHLEGPYRPHAMDPIKLDIRNARPAGTPFLKDGQLWRPAQDSSRTYGGRIAMNQVIELTPDRFQEVTVKYIPPITGTTYDQGIHTIAAVGDVTLIDGKRFMTVEQRKAEAKRRKLDKLKRIGRS